MENLNEFKLTRYLQLLKLQLKLQNLEDVNFYFYTPLIEASNFIITGPRQKTIPCFWHMVWQENVHCIVMATGLFENANVSKK